MILKIITNGYVVQTFDTAKQKFTNQAFYAEDGAPFLEDEDGDEVDARAIKEKVPYLPFEMVQPELLHPAQP